MGATTSHASLEMWHKSVKLPVVEVEPTAGSVAMDEAFNKVDENAFIFRFLIKNEEEKCRVTVKTKEIIAIIKNIKNPKNKMTLVRSFERVETT
jgi:hypothetical protein